MLGGEVKTKFIEGGLTVKVYRLKINLVRLVYIYWTPLPEAGYDRKSIFKLSKSGLNLEFTFSQIGCHRKVFKEPSLLYYFSIGGRRIAGFIPFARR